MKLSAMFLLVLLVLPIMSESSEYKGDHGILADQLIEWCTGGASYKNFCHGFLLGVYENSTCLATRQSPDWIELKKVFIGWVYSKDDEYFISASAATAFHEKYGCESALQESLATQPSPMH